MDQLAQVLQEIQQRRRFLVTSHARPDGDAIGSTLALAQIHSVPVADSRAIRSGTPSMSMSPADVIRSMTFQPVPIR